MPPAISTAQPLAAGLATEEARYSRLRVSHSVSTITQEASRCRRLTLPCSSCRTARPPVPQCQTARTNMQQVTHGLEKLIDLATTPDPVELRRWCIDLPHASVRLNRILRRAKNAGK